MEGVVTVDLLDPPDLALRLQHLYGTAPPALSLHHHPASAAQLQPPLQDRRGLRRQPAPGLHQRLGARGGCGGATHRSGFLLGLVLRQQLVERPRAVDDLPLEVDGVGLAGEGAGAVPLLLAVPHATVPARIGYY